MNKKSDSGVWTFLVIAVCSAFLYGIYNFTENAFDEAGDVKIVVLTDGDGQFTCKLGGTLASSSMETYAEAWMYCEDWRNLYEERIAFREREWKEVNGSKR